MNLPETYAAVCAKRPELAVDTLQHYMRAWWYHGDAEGHDIAAALILARWVEALPSCVCLQRSLDGWRCSSIASCGMMPSVRHSTPLEALAAYYLGEAT